MESQVTQNKLAARQCLMAADKFIKESQFVEAKKEIEKAKALDPSNLYIGAFIDRINYFEKEKNAAKKVQPVPTPKVPPIQTPAQTVKPSQPNMAVPNIPKQSAQPVVKPQVPPAKQQAPSVKPQMPPAKPQAPPPVSNKKATVDVTEPKTVLSSSETTPQEKLGVEKKAVEPELIPIAPKPVEIVKNIEEAQPKEIKKQEVMKEIPASKEIIEPKKTDIAAKATPIEKTPEPEPIVIIPKKPEPTQSKEELSSEVIGKAVENKNIPSTPSILEQQKDSSITESQFDEMRRKIDLLTKALEEEKKSREEMNRQQIQQSIAKFRSSLEKAWIDGAPQEQKTSELEHLAVTLSIPENVVRTITREVKIEMYGKAVKEVIAKRQLLRSSSSTLEWLRKVYKISMEEYLEYESKFLMDLVADQYKGTIVQISSDEETKKEITPRLKSMGYAVVTSPTPEDALEKIEKLNPNIIVCETNFGPGAISGIRFLHILRTNAKFNFIPFIFLSSDEDNSLLTSSELRPNEGFVQKPVNFDELSALINKKLLWLREYVMSLSK